MKRLFPLIESGTLRMRQYWQVGGHGQDNLNLGSSFQLLKGDTSRRFATFKVLPPEGMSAIMAETTIGGMKEGRKGEEEGEEVEIKNNHHCHSKNRVCCMTGTATKPLKTHSHLP